MLNTITSGPGKTIRALQEQLHRHRVHTSVAYDHNQPRLHVRNDLVVWIDPDGQEIFWTADPTERAAHGPAANLEEIARRISAHLAQQAEPVAAAL
jgi:hypothetical protein